MNHMKTVAELLGLELYQKFRISGPYSSVLASWFRFTDRSFEYYDIRLGMWQEADLHTLCNLLNGMYEVKEPYEVGTTGIKRPVVIKHILEENERIYLSNLIEPFRNEVIGIQKLGIEDTINIFVNTRCHSTILPGMKKEDAFSGMIYGRTYSIEELEL